MNHCINLFLKHATLYEEEQGTSLFHLLSPIQKLQHDPAGNSEKIIDVNAVEYNWYRRVTRAIINKPWENRDAQSGIYREQPIPVKRS